MQVLHIFNTYLSICISYKGLILYWLLKVFMNVLNVISNSNFECSEGWIPV